MKLPSSAILKLVTSHFSAGPFAVNLPVAGSSVPSRWKSDPSSLVYRDESAVLAAYPDPERAYREIVLPHKIALSLAYVDGRSVWSDLGILVRTALRLLAPALVARVHPAAGTGS